MTYTYSKQTSKIIMLVLFLISSIFINKTLMPVTNTNSQINDSTVLTTDVTVFETSTTANINNKNVDLENLPEKYDSRDYELITPVKSQASSDNCWAFATISALESDYIAQGLGTAKNTDFSESHLAWFANRSITADGDNSSSNEGKLAATPYKEAGNWFITTAALSRWSGIAKESSFPFPVGCSDTAEPLSEADRYVNDAGVIIKSAEVLDETDRNAIKRWIVEHGSVCVSLYNNFDYYNKGKDGYAFYYGGEETSNHQIVIIGWDDTFSVDNFNPERRPKSPGAWLCKDSQGEEWCDSGFSWVSYEHKSLTNFVGTTCQPSYKYDNNYTYNGYGWSASLTCDNNSCAANVFKANDNEVLKAVSFYTVNPNTKIQIRVYTNLPDNAATPVEGVLKYTSQELLFENWGYHTVDLTKEIELPKDTSFSIVLRFSSDSDRVQIPVESKNNSRGVTYVSKPGESYIYAPNYSVLWLGSEAYSSCNVCIQAFTLNK